jgi:hypothetical protein
MLLAAAVDGGAVTWAMGDAGASFGFAVVGEVLFFADDEPAEDLTVVTVPPDAGAAAPAMLVVVELASASPAAWVVSVTSLVVVVFDADGFLLLPHPASNVNPTSSAVAISADCRPCRLCCTSDHPLKTDPSTHRTDSCGRMLRVLS